MRFGKKVWAAWMISALAWAPAFAEEANQAPKEPTPAATASPETKEDAKPEAAPSIAPAPKPSAPAMDGSTYAVRLRDLEQRIDELKEQIRRSHTRLSLLTDTILSGGVAGSRAEIRFQNEMGGAYRLTRAVFILDGEVQYNQRDERGALADQREIPIFSGSVPPGDHTIQVHLQLQGHGYGVFSYMRGYQFEVKSSHSFTAIEGKTTNVQILAYERGGSTTAHEERPAVRYIEKVTSGILESSAAPGGSGISGNLSFEAGGK